MTNILNLVLILSLAVPLTSHFQKAFSFAIEDDDHEEYVIDTPLNPYFRPRKGRFLSNIVVKKGAHCDLKSRYSNADSGVSGNGGKSLVHCCRKQCQDVLRDINNCSECGQKCTHGKLCCNGV